MTFWQVMWFAFWAAGVFMVLVDDAPRAREEGMSGSELAVRLRKLFHGTWAHSILTALFWPLALLLGIAILLGYNHRVRARG